MNVKKINNRMEVIQKKLENRIENGNLAQPLPMNYLLG